MKLQAFRERMCDELAKDGKFCTAGRTLAGSVILLLFVVSWRRVMITVLWKIKFMGIARATYFVFLFFDIDYVASFIWHIILA